MKNFNYENDIVLKQFYFCDEVIVPELFAKTRKIERTCKELLADIMTLVEKSDITKKDTGWSEFSSRKKVLVKTFN